MGLLDSKNLFFSLLLTFFFSEKNLGIGTILDIYIYIYTFFTDFGFWGGGEPSSPFFLVAEAETVSLFSECSI